MLTVDELRADVESGAVDTVIAAFTDMQGRLMGKRLDAEFFLSENEAGHPGEGCNYLLALEMEMDPVPGYAIANMARDVGGLLDELGFDRVHMLGYSMGGAIAQEFVRQFPDRVKGLILCATMAGGPSATYAEPAVVRVMRDLDGLTPEQAARRIWTARIAVDASQCATPSGRFFIRFVRLKEIGPDLPFAEAFTWRPGGIEVSTEFAVTGR